MIALEVSAEIRRQAVAEMSGHELNRLAGPEELGGGGHAFPLEPFAWGAVQVALAETLQLAKREAEQFGGAACVPFCAPGEGLPPGRGIGREAYIVPAGHEVARLVDWPQGAWGTPTGLVRLVGNDIAGPAHPDKPEDGGLRDEASAAEEFGGGRRGDAVEAEELVTRRVAAHERDGALREAEDAGQQGDDGVIGRGIHGRGGDGDLEFAAMESTERVAAGPGLDLDGEEKAVGLRTEEGGQGWLRHSSVPASSGGNA